jgi:hypothetical protein
MSRLLRPPPLDPNAAWATIRAALDLVFTFPEDAGPAPALDAAYWAAAYAAVHAWCTTSRVPASLSDHMAALYEKLEAYVAEVCALLRPRLKGAPRAALLDTYLALYGAFRAHAAVAARIMAYLDRHHTARVRDEGKGWLRHIGKNAKPPHSREKYQNAAQPVLEGTWELAPDTAPGSAAWKEAEARAEAGSEPERVPFVGVQALCLRRWRLDVLEPLLLEDPDFIPSSAPAADEERAALAQLATSLKEIGLQAKDARRHALNQLPSLQTE